MACRVAVGKLTVAMDALEEAWRREGRDLTFVKNDDYTSRIRELVAVARKNPSATNEPAFRMLQILTRLRGGQFAV